MAQLLQAVCDEAGACTTNAALRRVPGGIAPEGVVLEDFFVGFVDGGVPIGIRPIPSGGFTKLLAEERLLGVYVLGRDKRSSRECHAKEDLTIASISPLQFDVFVEPPSSLSVTTSMTIPRLHRNDELSLSNVSVTHPTSRFDARLGTGVEPPADAVPQHHEAGSTPLRFLVDPAIVTDTGEITSRRLAHLSDIRIIDGVWYERVDDVPWPGKAVWSDHPGSDVVHKQAAAAIVQSSPKIGQADIRGTSTNVPTRYPYYKTDLSGRLNDSDGGVVSYGTMTATPDGPVPAVWPSFAEPTSTTDICGGHGEFTEVADCTGGRHRALLEATRSGFEHGGENVLSMNFDVEAFGAALRDRTPGELGSYFPPPDAGGSGGRPASEAGTSMVVASFIVGMPKGASVDQVFRSAEAWRDGGFAKIKGSVVVGFYSVFDTKTLSTVGIGKALQLIPDPHLVSPLIQPPGVPRVLAGVTGRWLR